MEPIPRIKKSKIKRNTINPASQGQALNKENVGYVFKYDIQP